MAVKKRWTRQGGNERQHRSFGHSRLACSYKLAKAKKNKLVRKPYTTADVKLLKQHSKARTPVVKISKEMKRSVGSLRQKALDLGIGLGHQR
jgi:hypothetical protein